MRVRVKKKYFFQFNFEFGKVVKLANFFSTPSSWVSSRETVNTKFKIIGLTRLEIKPKSTAPEADAVTTRPPELFKFTIAVIS